MKLAVCLTENVLGKYLLPFKSTFKRIGERFQRSSSMEDSKAEKYVFISRPNRKTVYVTSRFNSKTLYGPDNTGTEAIG